MSTSPRWTTCSEGINLRAMGQKDPLVEWQREGYEMFGQMIDAIDDDYREVRHARRGRRCEQQAPAAPTFDRASAEYVGAPRTRCRACVGMRRGRRRGRRRAGTPPLTPAAEQAPSCAGRAARWQPIVKGEHEKIGRNQPCWCGSGKKFKLCHGR